jgi:hypothetical protein
MTRVETAQDDRGKSGQDDKSAGGVGGRAIRRILRCESGSSPDSSLRMTRVKTAQDDRGKSGQDDKSAGGVVGAGQTQDPSLRIRKVLRILRSG